MFFFLLFTAGCCIPMIRVQADDDQRQYALGINFLTSPVNGKSYLIWSDAYDSGVTDDGDWTHDVFFQQVDKDKHSLSLQETDLSLYLSKTETMQETTPCVSDMRYTIKT